jgi:hypothetical protein
MEIPITPLAGFLITIGTGAIATMTTATGSSFIGFPAADGIIMATIDR